MQFCFFLTGQCRVDSRLHIILQRYSRRNGGRGTSTRNHHRNGRRTSLPDRLRGDGRGTPLLYDVDAVRENLTNPFPESSSLCRDAGAERRWRDPVSLREERTLPPLPCSASSQERSYIKLWRSKARGRDERGRDCPSASRQTLITLHYSAACQG